eukprot:NODE_2953_length_841_cov_6.809343_g2449_i0.p6 GENE.NODE_2953_length_841_cov_6.809343_g2449_i0~~NODE_2953_length_841_cov_6.809343_g2449_i0.p6  ORF type:complete len:53 (-),score=7.00 NODE_2953_length_841_cov_6.809343_g2449_i0:405-563(-)
MWPCGFQCFNQAALKVAHPLLEGTQFIKNSCAKIYADDMCMALGGPVHFGAP